VTYVTVVQEMFIRITALAVGAPAAKPADIPVEQPTKFELVIEFNECQVDRADDPRSVLLRADEVIE
jgi:hypothetical protein